MITHPVAAEVVAILEAALAGADRTIQTVIGPSQLGTTCLRCLVHGLLETAQGGTVPSWYAGAGTAIHWWAEHIVAAHELRQIAAGNPERWETETRVHVGTIRHPLQEGDLEIWGTCDLYDRLTGTVVDYKGAGRKALTDYRMGRTKTAYKRQAQLYGKGKEDAGNIVNECVILAIPRNGATLSGDCEHDVFPYDRADAETTLARADQWAGIIREHGPAAALTLAGPHTGEEFTCGNYPDAPRPPDLTDSEFLGL